MKQKTIIAAVIALVIIAALAFFCVFVGKWIYNRFNPPNEQTNGQPAPVPPGNVPPVASVEEAQKIYLALGNPGNAATNDRNNFLMVNESFAVSYNNEKGTPNWVSWRLTESDMGAADRQDNFRPDVRLAKTWNVVKPSDYTGSGYDRGHLCPSADRSASDKMNGDTFLMTNIFPQTGDLNRNAWRELEEYARKLVRRGDVDLYIVSGVYGEAKRLKKKVVVPTSAWKIMVAVPRGADISAINDKTHVVAVDMPNITGIANRDWRDYKTTVRAIEQKTNLNLLSNIPANIQEILETKIE